MKLCRIEGCTRPLKARGWCGTHWHRWRHNGDPLISQNNREHSDVCALPDCNRLYSAKGYCQLHYKRITRIGSFEPKLDQHGMYGTPTHTSWHAMMTRCSNRKNKWYFGKVFVCNRWQKFVPFFEDLGERPPETTLDRKDNSGHYSCGKCVECMKKGWKMNCQWATPHMQASNTSRINKTGFMGVYKKGNRYEATIRIKRAVHRLGMFDSPEDAHQAYLKAKQGLL